MARLRAGVGRVVVNPPLGIKTAGFSSRVGNVERIESDLSVTALVLASDTARVVIAGVDTALITAGSVRAVRRRVAEAVGTAPDHVMLNSNHTHSAPAPPDWIPRPPHLFHWISPEQLAMLRDYEARLLDGIVAAAVQAERDLQPARVGAGWGTCDLGVQRRELGPDGLVFLGEVPGGETDPAVGVLRVDDLDGRPIAVTLSYGCHTVVVGPRDRSASPDFPGAAREVVEQVLGGTALFLQGCGGDIMPRGGMGWETDCRDSKQRIGTMLAGEAIKVAADIRTHVRRGERTSLTSLSGISLWPWVPVEGDAGSYLGAAERTLALDWVDLPPLAEAERLRDQRRRDLDAAVAGGHEADICVAVRFLDAAERLVELCQGDFPPLEAIVQAVRIDDAVLVGINLEVFSGTGLTIKARSPFAHTQVLGYTNGCAAYLPRAQDYPPGGWDYRVRYRIPDLLFQSYSVPHAIHPSSEARVVEAALDLLAELAVR